MALPTYDLTVDLNEINNADYANPANTIKIELVIPDLPGVEGQIAFISNLAEDGTARPDNDIVSVVDNQEIRRVAQGETDNTQFIIDGVTVFTLIASLDYKGNIETEQVVQYKVTINYITDSGEDEVATVTLSMPRVNTKLAKSVGGEALFPTTPIHFYASSSITYDETTRTIILDIPGIPTLPLRPTYIVFVLPNLIPRNLTDYVGVQINTGLPRDLVDRDGNLILPSQLTPNRLYQIILLFISNVAVWRLVDPLEFRPQDYLIYTAWKPSAGFIEFTEADFLGVRGGSSNTNVIVQPTTTEEYRHGLWVPADTGDITSVFSSISFGDEITFYEDGGALSVAGVAGKVIQDRVSLYATNRLIQYTITQQLP